MSIVFESDHSINEKIYAHPDQTQFCDQWRCAKVEITLLVCKAYDSVQLLWGWNALLLHVVLLVDCMSLFSSLFIGCYLSLHACNAGCVGSASGKEPIGFVCTGWKWHWHCRCSTDFCSFMCIWRDGWLAFGVLYIWYVLLGHGCLLSWTLIFVSARLYQHNSCTWVSLPNMFENELHSGFPRGIESIELWNRLSRLWKSIELGQNVHKYWKSMEVLNPTSFY